MSTAARARWSDGVKRRFILQAIHPEYACSEFETMFETEQLDELRALLGPDAEDDPDVEKYYWLEATDLAALAECFGILFDAGGREVVLHARRDLFNDCPYLPHTNFELPLMLDGRKKFARLYHEYPPSTHLYEDRFDRFVAQGLLYKEVDVEPFERPIQNRTGRTFEGVRTAYYTLPGEEWRIQAWRLVEKAQAKTGWNETLERLEGILYGYEDWQNDWWAHHIRRKRG